MQWGAVQESFIYTAMPHTTKSTFHGVKWRLPLCWYHANSRKHDNYPLSHLIQRYESCLCHLTEAQKSRWWYSHTQTYCTWVQTHWQGNPTGETSVCLLEQLQGLLIMYQWAKCTPGFWATSILWPFSDMSTWRLWKCLMYRTVKYSSCIKIDGKHCALDREGKVRKKENKERGNYCKNCNPIESSSIYIKTIQHNEFLKLVLKYCYSLLYIQYSIFLCLFLEL